MSIEGCYVDASRNRNHIPLWQSESEAHGASRAAEDFSDVIRLICELVGGIDHRIHYAIETSPVRLDEAAKERIRILIHDAHLPGR